MKPGFWYNFVFHFEKGLIYKVFEVFNRVLLSWNEIRSE